MSFLEVNCRLAQTIIACFILERFVWAEFKVLSRSSHTRIDLISDNRENWRIENPSFSNLLLTIFFAIIEFRWLFFAIEDNVERYFSMKFVLLSVQNNFKPFLIYLFCTLFRISKAFFFYLKYERCNVEFIRATYVGYPTYGHQNECELC